MNILEIFKLLILLVFYELNKFLKFYKQIVFSKIKKLHFE